MELQIGQIWENDEETATFAKTFNEDLCLIFPFSLDAQRPHSLPSRVSACYQDSPVQDESQKFANRGLMRKAIRSSIQQVWPQCMTDPSIRLQDVVVDVYEDAKQQFRWRVCREDSFIQYIGSLWPVSRLLSGEPTTASVETKTYDYVHYSTLLPLQILGGRGSSTLVRSSERPGKLYVFKGIELGLFLESSSDFPHERDTFYHEL